MWFWLIIAFIWFGLGYVVSWMAAILAIPLAFLILAFQHISPFKDVYDWQRRQRHMITCRIFVGPGFTDEPLRTSAPLFSRERTIAALKKYVRCRYYLCNGPQGDVIFGDYQWAAKRYKELTGETLWVPRTWEEI